MSSHASLNSLPTELKTRIADECHRWDATRMESRQLFSRKYLEADKYPSAVGALFEVSREWHAIAAPFRFRSLSPRQLADPTFQLILGPKYGHHLKSLDLADLPVADMPALFTFLSSFTGTLEQLTIPSVQTLSTDLTRQWPDLVDRSFLTDTYVEDVLRRLIRVSETVSLTLHTFDTLDLCIGSNIKRLALVLTHGQERENAHLVKVLASCSALVELDVLYVRGRVAGEALTRSSNALPPPEAMPPVRRLHLETFVRSANLCSLVAHFAPTLVSLDLDAWSFSFGEAATISARELGRFFPRLATVTVRNGVDSAFPFLPPLSPAAFPSLRRLVWELPRLSSDPVTSAVSDKLSQIATSFAAAVTPLRIDVFARPDDLDRARAVVPSLIPPTVHLSVGIDPDKSKATEHPARFFRHPPLIEEPDEPLEVAQRAVDDSLRAIKDMTDFAVATGDRVQLAKIGEALQDCEWLRYNMRAG